MRGEAWSRMERHGAESIRGEAWSGISEPGHLSELHPVKEVNTKGQ